MKSFRIYQYWLKALKKNQLSLTKRNTINKSKSKHFQLHLMYQYFRFKTIKMMTDLYEKELFDPKLSKR